jgi:hypothetical protein
MLYREYFRAYERSLRKIAKLRDNAPLRLKNEYLRALTVLRQHLDDNGYEIPPSKYSYNPRDITTHAYLEDPHGSGAIRNPDFKYGHLIGI